MDYDLVDQSADRGFLYFWGGEGVEKCSLKGGNIREFRGGVRVVSVPAGAIGCVDAALDAAIRIHRDLLFHTSPSRSYSKTPNFLLLQDRLC